MSCLSDSLSWLKALVHLLLLLGEVCPAHVEELDLARG
jgi:hypothetical protein